MNWILIAVVMLVGLLPAGSMAASFDCSKARSTLEIMICSNAELDLLDVQVGEAYLKVRSTVSESSNERTVLLSEQREFLGKRTETCPIPSTPNLSESETNQIITCLKGVYTLRLNDLHKQMTASGTQNVQSDSAVINPTTNQNTETTPSVPTTTPDSNAVPNPPKTDAHIDEDQLVYTCTMSKVVLCNTPVLQSCLNESKNNFIEDTEQKVIIGVEDKTGIIMMAKIGVGANIFGGSNVEISSARASLIIPRKNPDGYMAIILDRNEERLFMTLFEDGRYISGSIGQCESSSNAGKNLKATN